MCPIDIYQYDMLEYFIFSLTIDSIIIIIIYRLYIIESIVDQVDTLPVLYIECVCVLRTRPLSQHRSQFVTKKKKGKQYMTNLVTNDR